MPTKTNTRYWMETTKAGTRQFEQISIIALIKLVSSGFVNKLDGGIYCAWNKKNISSDAWLLLFLLLLFVLFILFGKRAINLMFFFFFWLCAVIELKYCISEAHWKQNTEEHFINTIEPKKIFMIILPS